MNPGISFSVHFWRGIGGDTEPSLFWWQYRFGFLTASIDKVSLLESYRKLRDTMLERIAADQSRLNEDK